jgi:chromosome segregation ATPase
MSSTSILTAMFSIELALISSGIAYYFFTQVKKLTAALAQAQTREDGTQVSLGQLLEQQIQRTRKRIAGHLRASNDPEQNRSAQVLSKRVEFLELEKDVADDKIEEQSYWQTICDRMSNIVKIQDKNPQSEEAPDKKQKTIEASDAEPENSKMYKESILHYQEQLAQVHKEFEDFRKTAHRAVSLSSDYQGDDPDDALVEMMEDFKDHDERLHTRLKQLEADNNKLAKDLQLTEKEVMELNQEIKTKTSSPVTETENAPTASEEEIKRLHDIIDRQYGSLDELRMTLMQTETTEEENQKLQAHMEAVEHSQQELQGCIQVLESENDRLLEELQKATAGAPAPESAASKEDMEELYDLRLKTKAHNEQVDDLSAQLQAKDEALQKITAEFDSMQDEFMRMYEKQGG